MCSGDRHTTHSRPGGGVGCVVVIGTLHTAGQEGRRRWGAVCSGREMSGTEEVGVTQQRLVVWSVTQQRSVGESRRLGGGRVVVRLKVEGQW